MTVKVSEAILWSFTAVIAYVPASDRETEGMRRPDRERLWDVVVLIEYPLMVQLREGTGQPPTVSEISKVSPAPFVNSVPLVFRVAGSGG